MLTKNNFPNILNLLLLVIANSLPLIGKFFWGWDTYYFLLVYWADTAIILIFTYLKMYKAEGIPDPKLFFVSNKTKKQKIKDYFIISMGFLMILGGHIVFFTFIPASKYWSDASTKIISPDFSIVNYAIMLLFIFISNVLNYWIFIKNENYKTVSVEEAQGWSFARILLMFFVVLIGVFIFGSELMVSIVPLCIFVVLKNIGDIAIFLSTLHKNTNNLPSA